MAIDIFWIVRLGLLVVLTWSFGDGTEGKLLFNEEFDSLERWQHVVTAYRMEENQFQYYTNRPENSFIKDGKLFIKPTLTSDRFGEQFLHKGKFNLKREGCNLPIGKGCLLQAGNDIVNPIQSAALITKKSFSFTYGTLEIRAKMPRGDWLWPEISLMPANNVYGSWPRSGYISIASLRGNDNFTCNEQPAGNQVMKSFLEWGVDNQPNCTKSMSWTKQMHDNSSFSSDFRTYRLEWNVSGISIYVDEELIGSVDAPEGGFWNLTDSKEPADNNPWINGTLLAPFDQKFYVAMYVAVGGEQFDDNCNNYPDPKPWNNSSPNNSMSSFWADKNKWLPTWSRSSDDDSALQVDYVRVYA